MMTLKEIFTDFSDLEYRHAYIDEFINNQLATQIRTLRIARGLNQRDLAERAAMAQSRISALENVNYSSWSVATLKRLARAFDVALSIKFVAFGQALPESLAFRQGSLAVPKFEDEAKRCETQEGRDDASNVNRFLYARISGNTSGGVRTESRRSSLTRQAVLKETTKAPEWFHLLRTNQGMTLNAKV